MGIIRLEDPIFDLATIAPGFIYTVLGLRLHLAVYFTFIYYNYYYLNRSSYYQVKKTSYIVAMLTPFLSGDTLFLMFLRDVRRYFLSSFPFMLMIVLRQDFSFHSGQGNSMCPLSISVI